MIDAFSSQAAFFEDGRAPNTDSELEHAAQVCIEDQAMRHAGLLIDKIKDGRVRQRLGQLLSSARERLVPKYNKRRSLT